MARRTWFPNYCRGNLFAPVFNEDYCRSARPSRSHPRFVWGLAAADNHEIPGVVSGIVRRAMEKNASDRFHSVRDVAFALAAGGETKALESPREPDSAHSRWELALVPAIVIILLTGIWLWNPRNFRSRLSTPASSSIRSLAVLPPGKCFRNSGSGVLRGWHDRRTDYSACQPQ